MAKNSKNGYVAALKSENKVLESSNESTGSIGHVLISGVGFLADAYDLFVIDFVLAILSATSLIPPSVTDSSVVVSATLAGAVLGQLGFGVAADFLGRRIMFITTAVLVIFGSVASALVGWGYSSRILSLSVFTQLAICRFFLGVGIGGEYPLSATVATENESLEEIERSVKNAINNVKKKVNHKGCWWLREKPNSIAAVFSMQGIGMLLSPVIVICCLKANISLESTWRFCLGIGALPSTIAFFFRWRMHETGAFAKSKRDFSLTYSVNTRDTEIETDVTIAHSEPVIAPKKHISKQPAKSARFRKHLHKSWYLLKQFRWIILGTSVSWFLIDVTLYGTGSFKSAVVGQWFQSDSLSVNELSIIEKKNQELKRALSFRDDSTNYLQRRYVERILLSSSNEPSDFIARTDAQARKKILIEARMSSFVAMMAIPGYILSLFLIHKTGQKPLQFYGFIAVGAVFITLGIIINILIDSPILYLILFGLTFLCSNFGPNTTTFIMPTQLYPTIIRASCHGFSAAMGKLGGVVGTAGFNPLEKKIGLGWLMMLCGLVALLGAGTTLFIPSDKEAEKLKYYEEIKFANPLKKPAFTQV